MKSYLIDQVIVDENGISLFPFKENFIPWSTFYSDNFRIKFYEDFLGFSESYEYDQVYWYPYIAQFYWVELIPPKGYEEAEIIRIHFPKGRDQRDYFKNLVSYYILKKLNLLSALGTNDTAEANKILYNLFEQPE